MHLVQVRVVNTQTLPVLLNEPFYLTDCFLLSSTRYNLKAKRNPVSVSNEAAFSVLKPALAWLPISSVAYTNYRTNVINYFEIKKLFFQHRIDYFKDNRNESEIKPYEQPIVRNK